MGDFIAHRKITGAFLIEKDNKTLLIRPAFMSHPTNWLDRF